MKFLKSISGSAEIIKWNFDGESLVHWAQELSFEGFRLEIMGYKFPYLLNGGKTGDFAWCPVRGKDLYLSFQVQATKSESGTPRRFQAELDGEVIGEFTLAETDDNFYLFCSEEKIPFFGHRRIYLRVLEGDNVTVSSINFSTTPVFPEDNAIRNLTAKQGKVRFTTVKASVCNVLCGGETYEEDGFCNCHKIDIPAEFDGEYTVYATDREGNEISLTKTAEREEDKESIKKDFCHRLSYSENADIKSVAKAFFPFNKGECTDIENAGIKDENGNSYPADVKVTSTWEDGSIRTVSIDAVIIPDGRGYYFSSGIAPDFNEIKTVLPDKNTYVTIDGKKLSPAFGEWETQFSGNAKKVIFRKGSFDAPYDKLTVVETATFFKGIDGVSFALGIENSFTQPRTVKVENFYTEFSAENKAENHIYQIDDIYADINGEVRKERCVGIADVGENKLYIPDFWQNYPAEVDVKKDKTVIGHMPSLSYENIYSEYSKEEKRQLIYYMEDSCYRLHMGMRKLFVMGIAKDCDTARAVTKALLMSPDAEIIQESEAFGKIINANDYTKGFDKAIEDGYNLLMTLREKKREYGMFNYGDWFGERSINWGNNEYDMPYGALMQYLRTGDEKFAELGYLSARHMEEIDFVRVHSNEKLSGLFYLHTPGHSFFCDTVPEDSWPDFNTHVGHLFVQGLTEWYKVTGEERFKTAVLRCADTLAHYYCTDFDYDSEREPAWVMLVMSSAYELTHDNYYINAARILKERVLYKQVKETGALTRMLDFSECDRKFLFGGKPFMCGILMSAMLRYYEMSGDKEALSVMDGLAHWLGYEMWDDEAKGFWYTDYMKMRNVHTYPANSMEIIEGLLNVYQRTGDRLLYDRAKEAFLCATNLEYREGDVGKTLAMRLRFAPTSLKMLYDGQIK